MPKAWVPLLVLSLGLSGAARGAEISKMALITIELSTEVRAPAAEVWGVLTDSDKVTSWCPLWTKPPVTTGDLDAVGRAIRFRDEYGNEGLSVVLHADPARELRFAHVPDNGGYLCQTTITMTPRGRGVEVVFKEQYSDQLDVPIDRDTAATARDSIRGYLASLKQLAEAM